MPEKNDQNTKVKKPLVDNEMVDQVIGHEEHIPYMYKDTKGNVTAGAGFLIRDAKDAARYPFRAMPENDQYGRNATRTEIEDAYGKVSKKPFGQNYGAKTFSPFTDETLSRIGLDPSYGRVEAERKLELEEQNLKSKFPGFDQKPRSVQKVLLDMQYNIGDRKFRPSYRDEKGQERAGWPALFRAVDEGDYKKAADEVQSRDVNDKRNQWRKDMMLKALTPDKEDQ